MTIQTRHGRCDVESRGVFQEPRSPIEHRSGAEIFHRGEPAGEEVYDRRALHRLWQADLDWASQKSYRTKSGSDDGDGTDFLGQKPSNKTHESTTDADTRLYKKSYSKESKLSYLGHALVDNRNDLIAAAMVSDADGFAERDAALLMLV